MVLKKKQVVCYDNFLFQLRVDTEFNKEKIMAMCNNIKEYCKDRGYEIARHTVGYHRITATHSPHIHFHAEVKTTKGIGKSPERYYFNKYLGKNEPPDLKKSSIVLTKPKLLDGSGNIVEIEESILRCLRYPLKEGEIIEYSNIEDIDLQMKTAQAEFQFASEQIAKNEAKKAQEKLKWSKIVLYLDQQKPKSLEDAFSNLLDYLREENPTPSPASICRLAYNYSYKRKILSNREIIENELKHFKHTKNNTQQNIEDVNKFLESIDEEQPGMYVQIGK